MPSLVEPSTFFPGLPNRLRAELFESYQKIIRNFREKRWEPSELNGGKFCEAVYTIIKGHSDGKMPPRAYKPKNIVDDCKKLEQVTTLARSVRVQIPRMIVALYEIRNNRGVGHVGGDVDPNEMDSKAVLEMSKWLLAELIRAFHQTTVKEASDVVEALTERTIPIIWEVGNIKRILNPELSMSDQTLLLLFASTNAIPENDLFTWLGHSNLSVYRRDVLRPLHRKRLINYDELTRTLQISPSGVAYVEDNLPLEL